METYGVDEDPLPMDLAHRAYQFLDLLVNFASTSLYSSPQGFELDWPEEAEYQAADEDSNIRNSTVPRSSRRIRTLRLRHYAATQGLRAGGNRRHAQAILMACAEVFSEMAKLSRRSKGTIWGFDSLDLTVLVEACREACREVS